MPSPISSRPWIAPLIALSLSAASPGGADQDRATSGGAVLKATPRHAAATATTPAARRGGVVASRVPADTAGARTLLRRVSSHYRSASSYLFEGQVDIRMTMTGREAKVEIPFTLAAMKPARMRTEMVSSAISMVAVCDGQHVYNYMPRLNQYTRRDASALAAIGDSLGLAQALATGTPLERPVSLATGLREARFLGTQTMRVGDRSVRCQVVEAQYGVVPGRHLAISPNRVWIDVARRLVVRDSVQTLSVAASGDTVTTEQVTTFHRSVVDEMLPESLFTFRPPAGAELVDQPHEAPSPLVGKAAEQFTLVDLAGYPRTLSTLRGKVVLLDFWATWCAPCRREMPNIAKLHRELESKGLAVVAVNVAEKPEVVSAFMTKNAYDLTVLLDPDGKVASLYGANALPTLVVIDREGNVASHLIGLRSESEVRTHLKKLGIE